MNVRCHQAFDASFGSGSSVLVGANGTGKTSVLEAVHFLLRGWSPRTAQPREIVTEGRRVLRVEAELADQKGHAFSAALGYAVDGERRLTVDGSPVRDVFRLEETVPVRMFVPDDLRLVKGSPRRRRQYLDALAGASSAGYRQSLARYEEALQQRNALLRSGVVGADHLPWEVLLAREGLTLVHARARSLAGIAGPYAWAHRMLAGERIGPATLSYRTNVAELDEPAYRHGLAKSRDSDRRRTFTHLGPHRDDVRFLLEGRDLRDYGSQGEQRTALLALMLAEREWRGAEGGAVPLLLLDDVMSELDGDRRRALMRVLAEGGQAVLTTTDLHYFTGEELEAGAVIELPGRGAGSLGETG